MDTDSATNNTSQTDTANLDPLANSVMIRVTWGQRAVSPWVQRQMESYAPSTPSGLKGGNRHTRTALSVPHTNTILNRLQRTVDKSTIWRPAEVGSVNPQMVSRFTQTIAQRYSDDAPQQKTQPEAIRLADTPDLTLAGSMPTEEESATAPPQSWLAFGARCA